MPFRCTLSPILCTLLRDIVGKMYIEVLNIVFLRPKSEKIFISLISLKKYPINEIITTFAKQEIICPPIA